ncbi:MAG: glycerophosphodiester phosphodiesterase [Acidobacteria bacterium]|nr:glycerophosphodiester phosphodiesterase [Acidobacteriota bacterium]
MLPYPHDLKYLQTRAFAHRGFGKAENSLAAFRNAAALGFSHVETDVHTTADGVALLFHDDTLQRVTGTRGAINELRYAELEDVRINNREPLCTLRQLATECPDLQLNLDIKDEASVQSVAALIEELGLHDRVLVASFSDRRRRAVLRQLSRRTASSAGAGSTVLFLLLGWLPPRLLRRILPDVDALQIPPSHRFLRIVTPGLIRRAHRTGMAVHVWTINEAAQMNEYLDMGVDAVMTDRADVLALVMRARGYWR